MTNRLAALRMPFAARGLAVSAAVASFVLIVFGSHVRVTDSVANSAISGVPAAQAVVNDR